MDLKTMEREDGERKLPTAKISIPKKRCLFWKISKIVQNICIVYVLGVSVLVAYCGGVNETVLGIVSFINGHYGLFYGGEAVDVKISTGIIRGFKSSPSAFSRDGRPFYEFLGIPFAKPPIGGLRFEHPEPVEPWDGVRETNSYASKCLQFDPFVQVISGSEDCLYLNIFTPQIKTEKLEPKLPVIVFIHGGLFMFGRAELFRPDYMLDEDVVLVSIHYRLGALGFLNTGDGKVRGNMGLRDQILALKWVQENIVIFGGDPGLVTLLGESAGAASIHYHMMSNASKGLFQRAITMSGTALSHWAFVDRPKEQAQIYASKLNCPTNDTSAMVDCLKATDVQHIAELFKESDDRLAPRLSVFVPTVESVLDLNTVVTDSPRSLLRKGQLITKVPWLNGVNAEEGLIYAFSMLLNETCVNKMNSEWNTYAPILFDYEEFPGDGVAKNTASLKVRQFYMGEKLFEFGTPSVPKFVPMFSDSSFNIGLVETANYFQNLTQDVPMYLYQYSYRAEHAIAQVYFNKKGQLPLALDALIANGVRWVKRNIFGWEEYHYGASHADELVVLFQFPLVLGRITKESKDYTFSKKLIKIWTTFAKNGNPNGAIPTLPEWPQVERNGNRKYMNLNTTFELIEEPFSERLQFWKNILTYKGLNL